MLGNCGTLTGLDESNAEARGRAQKILGFQRNCYGRRDIARNE